MSVLNICCGSNNYSKKVDANKLRNGILNFLNNDDDAPPFDLESQNAINMIQQAYMTEVQGPRVSAEDIRNVFVLEFERNIRIEMIGMHDKSIAIWQAAEMKNSNVITFSHSTKQKIKILESLKNEQRDFIVELDRIIEERVAYKNSLLKSKSFFNFFFTIHRICHECNPCLVSSALQRSVLKVKSDYNNHNLVEYSIDSMNDENAEVENYFCIKGDRFSYIMSESCLRCPACCITYEHGQTFFWKNPCLQCQLLV